MSRTFRLPDLGEGVHEAEILAIHVKNGQSVNEGDPLLEVETDKAAVEIPSPVTGRVETIHVKPGDMANVGDVLISFNESGSDVKNVAEETVSTHPTEPAVQQTTSTTPVTPKRVIPASPSTRRIARELEVDLHKVTPTGKNGIVTAQDVRLFAEGKQLDQPATAEPEIISTPVPTPVAVAYNVDPLPDFSHFGEVERQPFRSIRRATANRMSASWSQIPHVNCQDIVDITLLEEFRKKHKGEVAEAGGRLTMTVFALKAVATALKSYPHFNASLDLENQEIIIKKYFNIGVAVDTEHGLMVPVIRDVDRKSIKELSIELHDAISRARERKLRRDELIGGSFTITNAGAIGGSHFSAIINHPEIAILGLGQGRMQPAVMTDADGNHEIAPRLQMPIVLCFDHRVVDGADAIRFMQVIINGLQDPDELLITMI